MKTGFSLFLMEFVDPFSVGYDDCKTFHIVCPACKEPVFKVVREGETSQTHFFSHYRKDETLNKQCELRVNGISSDRIVQTIAVSRKQKLELYLQVFQNLVWDLEYDEKTIKKARQKFFLLARSETYSQFRKNLIDCYRKLIDDKEEISDYFDESLENLYGENNDYRSSYAILIQKEFAYFFFQYLLAGNSKTNYYFLLNHAFIKAIIDLERKKDLSALKDFEYQILDYMQRFLRTQNDKKRMELMQKMGTHYMVSPYSGQDSDLFVMFGASVIYNAFGILMRIPYLKILQENPQNLKKINLEELINECTQKAIGR